MKINIVGSSNQVLFSGNLSFDVTEKALMDFQWGKTMNS